MMTASVYSVVCITRTVIQNTKHFVCMCVKNKSPPTHSAKPLFIALKGRKAPVKGKNKNMTYRQQLICIRTLFFQIQTFALQNYDQIKIFVAISRKIHFVDG